MSGFICKVLSVHLLSHFPKLITLIAQDANRGVGLNALTDASEFLKMNLDLQHIDKMQNQIKSLPDGLFHHRFRQKLSILLDRNNLQSLPNFPSKPNTIQLISLKYNKLSCLSDDDMAMLNIIKPSSVFLGGNPIECSCNILRFLKWVNHSGFISNVNGIECSKGFSLCLYHKDFKGGTPIAECIVEAINSSRKVAFVITEDFLESSWGTYEIEMTRTHAFQEGRESMIIVTEG
ncbi:unnamed protein product [Mytilus coruscus]|uniref:TIR domain-containing protein n=1 Tax=Mytilus coruscus TaxID=42192 RepID=A0A6J8AJS4_MYTCO|nr:unnamed protein product [Mytilus coruscus]